MNQREYLQIVYVIILVKCGVVQVDSDGEFFGPIRNPPIFRWKRKHSCLPSHVKVGWDAIRNQLHEAKRLVEPADQDVLLNTTSYGGTLEIQWCGREQSECSRDGSRCALGTLEKKNTALAITSADHHFLVYFDYLEAKDCLCKAESPGVDVFPVITRTNVARPCKGSLLSHSGPMVLGQEGENVTLSFEYSSSLSGDVPSSIMILKAFKETQPLIINFIISIKNTQTYDEDSNDWRRRASATFGTHVIKLQLQNVSNDDEGTYFCRVKFLNSTSCFSRAELRVSGTTQEVGGTSCMPKMTKLKPTFDEDMSQLTESIGVDSVAFGEQIQQALQVRKCLPEDSTCEDSHRMCSSASSRVVKSTLCLRSGTDGNETSKVQLEYLEDEACSCKLKDPFDFSSSQRPTTSVSSIRSLGSCPDDCQPEKVKIKWHDLREYLNSWTYLTINATVEGKPLKVKKCHQSLTPCKEVGKVCKVMEAEKARKRIKLQNIGMKLDLKFHQAKTCKCTAVEDSSNDLQEDANAPPVITYAKVSPLSSKKRKRKS